MIDGEAAVLIEHGVSDFNQLQRRVNRRRWYAGALAVTYCAFDLLVADGQELMALPLVERKARLQELVGPCERGAVLFFGDLPARRRPCSRPWWAPASTSRA